MELVAEKYKQTELGLIPEDWEVVSLGEIFEFKNGLNKEKHFFGKGTPIVNYMDVFKNYGLKSDDLSGRVTLSQQEIKNYEVRKGDVFFTRTSETVEEIGISAVMLEEVEDTVFSGFVLRARPINDKLDLGFKKYCFSTREVRKEITAKSSYTTRALTNGRLLSAVKIAIPPTKSEQTAIATALSDMDALIAQTEKLIEKKKAIKQGVMQELLRPKEGWVTKKLGDISYCYAGGTPSTFNRQFWDGHIPWLPSGRVKNNIIKPMEDETYITDLGLKNSAAKLIKPNSVLVAITGATCGNIGLLTFEASANQSVVAIEPDEYTDFGFIYYSLLTMRDAILRLQTGSAQGGVNLKAVKSLEISIPKDKIEQNNISQILFDFDRDVENLKSKLQKLKLQKQGMMQALLTGKIRLI